MTIHLTAWVGRCPILRTILSGPVTTFELLRTSLQIRTYIVRLGQYTILLDIQRLDKYGLHSKYGNRCGDETVSI